MVCSYKKSIFYAFLFMLTLLLRGPAAEAISRSDLFYVQSSRCVEIGKSAKAIVFNRAKHRFQLAIKRIKDLKRMNSKWLGLERKSTLDKNIQKLKRDIENCAKWDLPPKAYDQHVVMNGENREIKITLEGTDLFNRALAYELVSKPLHGTISNAPTGLLYRSNGVKHSDGFTFRVSNGRRVSKVASVSIEVKASGARKTSSIYYISPTGRDDDSGTTPSTPWKTFRRVFNSDKILSPGDTLILLDGTYSRDTTGFPSIKCDKSGNAPNGEQQKPITITALNERRALLESDGASVPFSMEKCSWWNISGLYIKSGDSPLVADNIQGTVLFIRDSNNLTLKRLLLEKPNRHLNTHALILHRTSYISVIETEIYNFHRHAFSIPNSHHVVVTRSYANSRDYPGLPGCTNFGNPKCASRESYVLYGTSYSIIENSVSEERANGFAIHGGSAVGGLPGGHHNQILGSIAIGSLVGINVDSRIYTPDPTIYTAQNNWLVNVLILRPENVGMYFRSASGTVVENSSVMNSLNNQGYVSDQRPDIPCADVVTGCSTFIRNSLSVGNRGVGFNMTYQKDWIIENSNAFNNGGGLRNYASLENISDDSGNIRRSLSVAPSGIGSDGALIWIPAASNMRGAGSNGSDIGASVRYRYENGILTNQPLWNPTTRQFPCGAIVPGVNDIRGQSCFDVHERLNVQHTDFEN